MTIIISIEKQNLLNKFAAIINHIADVRQDFFDNEPMLRKNIQDNISIQSNPNGSFYKPLSKHYISSKAYARRARLSPASMDTARYRNNFLLMPNKNGLTVKPTLPYTIYHESTAPRKKMPWRSAAWFSNKTIKRLCDNLADSLVKSK